MTDKLHSSPMRKTLQVRWGDLDALNHVNNTRFLRYIEEVRVDWFESLAFGWAEDGIGPVVANININFRRPILWPATLCVDLQARWSGGKSIVLMHEIRDRDDPSILYGDAEVTVVWVDYDAGKTVPLPPAIRRGFATG